MINILYLHAGAEMYGADKVLLELISALDKSRFNPVVVLPCEGVLVDKLRSEGIKTYVIPYPILRRKYFNIKGMLNYCISYIKYSKQMLKLIKNMNINILHINTTAVLEGIYLKRKLKVPLLWHVHEIILKPKAIYKFISFLLGRYSDVVVSVSKATGQHIINSNLLNQENLKIIYNGVRNEVFNSDNDTEYLKTELGIPKDAIIVGMIGRVNSWKGQNDFLDSVDPILNKYKNVYAVLVGGVFEGEEWRMVELKNRISNSLNNDRICLLDFRSDSANIHNMFDVFVLPSTNPDPLPTVVLESMATGKPIVGYRHGGVCEMVDDKKTGFLAEVGNIDDLSEKIELLIVDEKLRKEMGALAQKRQNGMFSVDSYICNFEKIYMKLVEG